MSYPIPFNSSKVEQNGFNNTYTHQFVGSAVNLRNAEIAIHSISMYNSVYNIDGSVYGNNTFSIEVPTAGTSSTININLPPGIYSYTDIAQLIQARLVSAGAYLINADGLYIHYVQLIENRVYYAAQLDLSPVPTALPSGWTRPATGLYSTGGTGLPTTTRVPRLVINNAAFGKILGFSPGTYPPAPQTTLQSLLSNIVPTIHPVTAYQLRCNLITNKFLVPSDILGTFDKGSTSAGDLISYRPNEHNFVPVADGSYSNIRLTIVDQDGGFVLIRDPNIQITIVIRERA